MSSHNPSTSCARPLMIQGTASSSGKSLITTALCRIFHHDSRRVAPFKAQNMSNNSYVTQDGLEMGRAQVVQAYASGLEPDIRMNPVLLKPSSDTGSQVVLRGRPAFTMNARAWHESRDRLRDTIRDCYQSLAREYDIIVIEGAGSPAEINLKHNDIVNMGMARMADAPVLLVGDIDRGGVFASLVGTMHLLDDDERQRIKGFIINKFRGDVDLLKPGLDQLEALTGVPVLGVVPWMEHAIDEEDGVSERFTRRVTAESDINICIIRLPHISNYTDFMPLESVPGVRVRWCDTARDIGSPDLLILPGTKATIADLRALQTSGIADAVVSFAQQGGCVFGMCGGFQMLGNTIADPDHVESCIDRVEGLGLLDMTTRFTSGKLTGRVRVELHTRDSTPFALLHQTAGHGYEIHMGHSEFGRNCAPFTVSTDDEGNEFLSGITDSTGRIIGTYVHGLFDAADITAGFVNSLRIRKKLDPLDHHFFDRTTVLNRDINRLADCVRGSVDMPGMYRIMGRNNVAP